MENQTNKNPKITWHWSYPSNQFFRKEHLCWRWSRLARENTVYLDDELSLPSVRILLRRRQHFHKGQVSSPGGDLLSPGPSSAIKNPLAWKIKIHSQWGCGWSWELIWYKSLNTDFFFKCDNFSQNVLIFQIFVQFLVWVFYLFSSYLLHFFAWLLNKHSLALDRLPDLS